MSHAFFNLTARLKGLNDPHINMAREGWDRLHKMPGGKRLYSFLVGRYVPYTGNIHAQVEELGMGFAQVSLEDKPAVRNHLRCVHAIALANLAELTGNIALSYSMPNDARFIVSRIDIAYLKKARGKLTCYCECPIPSSSERQTYEVPVRIVNAANEEVCRATLYSLVGPKSSRLQ